MSIKTFRGQIADNGIETIRLSTNDGLTGYQIKKFILFPIEPQNNNQESTVQVYTVKPDVATTVVNFSAPTLLAVAYMENDNSGATPTFIDSAIFFDNVKFNQDIFLAHTEQGSDAVNYYLELEQVKLDLNEATVATLKDMRGRE